MDSQIVTNVYVFLKELLQTIHLEVMDLDQNLILLV